MGTRKSNTKRHRVLDDEKNVDRLSALPDGVICHILSFLPTHLTVKTSILAKRWMFLWAHVPVLDFNNEECSGSQTTTSFPSIVCTVMLRHKVQSLKTFRLTCTDDYFPAGCYELDTCVATAIERNVQNLYLCLSVKLPRCVLTCRTLVDLTTGEGVTIPDSGPISLPNLKKLYLYSSELYDGDLPCLLSGCPVLEELTIDLTCYSSEGCIISSPTLKSLTIDFPEERSVLDDYRLELNAPALRYLKVYDYMYKHISVSRMNSLIEAHISLYTLGDLGESDFCCVLKFLDILCNVKCLTLSGFYVKSCNIPVPGSIAKFGNLTKLEFFADWCFLAKILESADHLQVLIITEDCWNSKHWIEPMEEGCACLSHSLTTVTINGFQCTDQGFNMIRFFLRNALVLERMEIHCPLKGLKKKFDAIRRISLFRRGSMECELDFT